jgi:hypothetical protein
LKIVPIAAKVVVEVVTCSEASALTVTEMVVVPVAANWAKEAGAVSRAAAIASIY